MPYKQVFARLYNADALGDQPIDNALAFLPDGRLSVRLSTTPELIDIGVPEVRLSTVVLTGDNTSTSAQTPDGRYFVEIETVPHDGINEYWLIHADEATGKFKRAKLTSEWRPDLTSQPRVVVSPQGSFFIVDDNGTVRLYSAPHFLEAGTFQVSNANTANQIIALAVSDDERLIAGLSAWKDIVLYNVPDRRVAFVRQIRDDLGWYDPYNAHIVVVGDGEAIVTVGISDANNSPELLQYSVNVFKFVSLNLTPA